MSLAIPVTATEITEIIGHDRGSCTLAELDAASRKIGLQTFSVVWSQLPDQIQAPAIVPVVARGNTPHFVALLEVSGDRAYVVDYPRFAGWMPISSFKRRMRWDGTALHLARDEAGFRKVRQEAFGFRRRFFWPVLLALVAVLGVFKLRRARSARGNV
jgi:ABC-type bacteriocin/lantibiotic exporter with double-glycine peptidase domain